MTSTAGTDEHPEVAEISAFAEGLLSPERSADLRGHLAHCVLCADVRDSLAEIRGLLGTLPGPPRMPEDVAGRIDAALAAEALINATTPDATPAAAGPRTEPVSPAAGTRTTHVSRETSPTADRPAGRSGAATGPGRSARGSRRRWRILTAAGAVAVLGVGGLLIHSLDDQGAPSVSAAGTFSGVTLPTRVHQLLDGSGQVASPNTGARSGRNTPFSAKTPPVPSCVLKATGRPDGPLAASRGTYDGRSSYLVVLAHPSDLGKVDAYVVDASCAAHGPSATPVKVGTVLAQRTYARR